MGYGGGREGDGVRVVVVVMVVVVIVVSGDNGGGCIFFGIFSLWAVITYAKVPTRGRYLFTYVLYYLPRLYLGRYDQKSIGDDGTTIKKAAREKKLSLIITTQGGPARSALTR